MNKFLIAAPIIFVILVIVNYKAPILVLPVLIALFISAIGAFLTNKTDKLIEESNNKNESNI